MTPAGLNQVCNLIRFSYPSDDVVGGAVPSGTVLYSNLDIRISAQKPSQVLLEQGLQVPALFIAMLFEGNIEIEHNDQVEITAPAMGFYYQKKFRIVGIQRSSSHPAQDRNHIRIILKRWEKSHDNDLQ